MSAKPLLKSQRSNRPHALVVTATLNGSTVEEVTVKQGVSAQFGGTNLLSIPTPEGYPYIARVLWTGRNRVTVQDGGGHQHILEPGNDVAIELGSIGLKLTLAEQFVMRRSESWSIRGSLAWFTVVLAATIVSMQGGWWQNPENHCRWAVSLLPSIRDMGEPLLWLAGPVLAVALVGSIFLRQAWREAPTWVAVVLCAIVPATYSLTGAQWKSGATVLGESFSYCLAEDEQENGVASGLTAEYLARLLREDYDGDENGAIQKADRPNPEKRAERVYLPAGNEGPITKMGGAADTSRDPIRSPSEDDMPLPAKKQNENVPLFVEDAGSPVEVENVETEAIDGIADVDVPTEEAEPALDAPAEEEEGWGIPDWYDEQDVAVEDLEIDLMIRAARNRLVIDPDDPAALSILSYYQYLAQDYDAAIKTYDRYISLYPEDAAGYNNKALIYKRRGEYPREEALYRVALAIEPLDVTALNNLGVNLAHQGRYDEALAVMEQLEQLDPGDPYADLHRAKIYAEQGDEEAALMYLERALDGMKQLDTLHHIEFRQDIRVDPSFERLRQTHRFRAILDKYYGKDSPLQE